MPDNDKFMTDMHKRIKLLDAKLKPPVIKFYDEIGGGKDKKDDKKKVDLKITYQQYEKLFGKHSQLFNKDVEKLMQQYEVKEIEGKYTKIINDLFNKMTSLKIGDGKKLKIDLENPKKPKLKIVIVK